MPTGRQSFCVRRAHHRTTALDTQTLIGVFQRLLDLGATIIVIEHDLDVIANCDYIIDLGPGGGEEGGRIVAQGTPEQIAANPASVTGRFLSISPNN